MRIDGKGMRAGSEARVQAIPGGVAVRIGRRFGPEQARELERRLRLLAPIQRLIVDFAAAAEVDDAAIGVLVQVIGRGLAGHVELRGLSLHQRRMLRYLGVSGGTATA